MSGGQKRIEQLRIGFFPLTADPIHYGHLLGALDVKKQFNLDTIYIQICGDLTNHKPTKVSKEHRHAMAKLAIKEFEPDLRYTPLGYDNPLAGEEIFISFIHDKPFSFVNEFYYIAGVDNEQIVRERFLNNKARLGDKVISLAFLVRDSCQNNSAPEYVTSRSSFSSTLFREHIDNSFVPESVLDYCKKFKLYGY